MIIPTFDVKNGKSVCGKSGNRSEYTPLKSIYGEDILTISKNLKKEGYRLVYIADLDKIEDCGDNSEIISKVNEIIPVMLDNGCSDINDFKNNQKICSYSILATESMTSLEDAYEIFKEDSTKNIVFSVDIKNNELLIKNNAIKLDDIFDLINTVKPNYTILLNISQVGTEESEKSKIIEKVIDNTPYTQHILAGGLTKTIINKYKKDGFDNFLVGTVLHKGLL